MYVLTRALACISYIFGDDSACYAIRFVKMGFVRAGKCRAIGRNTTILFFFPALANTRRRNDLPYTASHVHFLIRRITMLYSTGTTTTTTRTPHYKSFDFRTVCRFHLVELLRAHDKYL